MVPENSLNGRGPRIIAVAARKGGVGKTTAVQNLSAELAMLGRRVLQIDLDPQSNLTKGWGLNPDEDRPTIYHAILDPEEDESAVRPANAILVLRENLALIPANRNLDGAQERFHDAIDRNERLKLALEPITSHFDLVVIDTPPSLGFLTVNALFAATDMLALLEAEPFGYESLEDLDKLYTKVRRLNKDLRWLGIVANKCDTRKKLHRDVIELTRSRYGDLVLTTIIPPNVAIAEATVFGQSVREYQPRATGAQAFHSLAVEVLNRAEA